MRAFWRSAVVFLIFAAVTARFAIELQPAEAELGTGAAAERTPDSVPFVHVLPVPDGAVETWEEEVRRIAAERYPDGEPTPAFVGVAMEEGETPYEPIPFAADRAIRFVAYGGVGHGHNIVPFDPMCRCDPTGAASAAMEALGEQERQSLSLLLLRSALYRYAEDFEFELPESLDTLTRRFPGNYLSAIPDFGDETLLYRPERFRKHAIWDSLHEVIALEDAHEPYVFEEPLTLTLYKSSFRVALESGDDVIRQYPATIGRPDEPSPNGMYQVELRVNEPISATKLFGTRALSFARGAYAIHGTNGAAPIGEALSNGCIRLENEDVEELFALTPLGTTLRIVDEPSPFPDRSVTERYEMPPGDGETTRRIFRWRG